MAEGGASQAFNSPKMNPRGARDTLIISYERR